MVMTRIITVIVRLKSMIKYVLRFKRCGDGVINYKIKRFRILIILVYKLNK